VLFYMIIVQAAVCHYRHAPLVFLLHVHVQPFSMTSPSEDQQSLKDEIADLEARLHDAKAQLKQDHRAEGVPLDAGPYRNYRDMRILKLLKHSTRCSFSPTQPFH
jgi:hypothetical protein